MGDGRTYEYVVGLRAVTSTDGMTADFTATRIINEVKRDGWVEPTGRANARPMINSAIPHQLHLMEMMGFAGSTHPAYYGVRLS
jgi:hypothetical protein